MVTNDQEVADLLKAESSCSTRDDIMCFLYFSADPNRFHSGPAPAVAKLADQQENRSQPIRPGERHQKMVELMEQVRCPGYLYKTTVFA